ncbi:MAG TPA: hypothetical protein VFI45_10605 [Candidatus Acidoferrum sp.]|nr:hypothetical protein [Candidatus Acidoferrum sp.]
MILLALQAAWGLLLLSLAAAGVGFPVFRRIGTAFHPWERVVLSLLGGWGMLSLVLYLIGQVAFSRWMIFVVTCGFAALGLRFIWEGWRHRETPGPRVEKRALLPAALVMFILLVTAVAGLAPVAGDWGSDAVAYHLLGPKVWLRAGVIRPVADNCHTAFPQTAETMYAALFAIGGPSAPCFADFFTFGLLLAVAASLATRCGLDAKSGWWVAAIVATMPAVFSGAHFAFVDGLYAAFFLAVVRIALDAENLFEWTSLGIFRGLLVATKYTGLLAVPVLAVGFAFLRRKGDQEKWGRSLEGFAFAGIATLAVAAGYYVRNWLLLGCPIYPPPPGLVHLCQAKYLSAQAVLDFHQYILRRGAGLGRGPLALLLLPFNLTYHTANFHGAGGIGLVPLGLAPIGIFTMRKSLAAKFLVILAGLLTLAWFLTQQESRFLIHVYVIAAVFGVIGWHHCELFGGRIRRFVAGLLVGVSVLYGLFMIVKVETDSIHAVFSTPYAAKRRAEQIPYVESFDFLNRDPSMNRVLILDRSVPPFYLDQNYVKPFGQWGELTVLGVTSPQDALAAMGRLSITHVLDVNSEVAPFQVHQPAANLHLVFEAKNQRVYRVE